MDTLLKAGLILVAIGSFATAGVSPVAAESEHVHFYNSPAAAAAKLPFSQAARVGDVLYMSGAIGVLPGKMELAPGGLEPETKQMMENIEGKRPDVRRRVQMHSHACRHVKMGCIQ